MAKVTIILSDGSKVKGETRDVPEFMKALVFGERIAGQKVLRLPRAGPDKTLVGLMAAAM